MAEMNPPSKSLSAAWKEAERKLWLAGAAPETQEKAEAGKIDLSTGSPRYDVSTKVREAIAAKARELDHLEYPPTTGQKELREAIAKFDREHIKAPYGPDQVVITYGAMQALSDVIGAVVPRGDEVLLPTPYWFQFPKIVMHTGAVPKDIRTFPGNNFKLTPKLLAAAITPRSRLLILTNPNNPTGAVYSRAELADLVEVLKKNRGLLVASDEVYNLLFPGSSGLQAAPSLCSFPEIETQVILINSLSKNFAMSGLRVGYAATLDPTRLSHISERQRFTSLGVNVYLQAGALAAIQATSEIVGEINRTLVERRRIAGELLGSVPRFRFVPPEAAFYYWVDVSGWFGCLYRDPDGNEKVIRDDLDFVTYMELEIPGKPPGVAMVSGTGCAMPGYVRITYAVPEDDFAEGVRRIRDRLDALVCD